MNAHIFAKLINIKLQTILLIMLHFWVFAISQIVGRSSRDTEYIVSRWSGTQNVRIPHFSNQVQRGADKQGAKIYEFRNMVWHPLFRGDKPVKCGIRFATGAAAAGRWLKGHIELVLSRHISTHTECAVTRCKFNVTCLVSQRRSERMIFKKRSQWNERRGLE